MNEATIAGLWHFPVKGLSGQSLDEVTLRPGEGFPHDRVYAFARANGAFDPNDPKPLPKGNFHMLARDAALVKLHSHYADGILRLEAGAKSQSFDLRDAEGRKGAEAFLSAYLGLDDTMMAQLAIGGPHRFTDVSVDSVAMMNAVSLINLSTVRALGQQVGQELDPMRFRGNIYFDGYGPRAELEWEGRTVAIGEARLKVVRRTQRCAATTVNPATAERDVMVPRHLMDLYGHAYLGVYAEVVAGGTVREGDTMELLPA